MQGDLRAGASRGGQLLRALGLLCLLHGAGALSAGASDPSALRLVQAARSQVGKTTGYDPAYRRLAYPMGDVPLETGVCADVVVRALRKVGVDLQVLVHEDLRAHFDAYPKIWGLKAPDPNIDHRRVPNLETYFRRRGMALPATSLAGDYLPGDFVTWRLPGNLPHIGIVSDRRSADGARPLILHNVGEGTREEDVLFAWPPTGHFRFFGPRPAGATATAQPSASGSPAK